MAVAIALADFELRCSKISTSLWWGSWRFSQNFSRAYQVFLERKSARNIEESVGRHCLSRLRGAFNAFACLVSYLCLFLCLCVASDRVVRRGSGSCELEKHFRYCHQIDFTTGRDRYNGHCATITTSLHVCREGELPCYPFALSRAHNSSVPILLPSFRVLRVPCCSVPPTTTSAALMRPKTHRTYQLPDFERLYFDQYRFT